MQRDPIQLVFDIGNSAIKGGIYRGPVLERTFRTTHATSSIAAAIDSEIRNRQVDSAGIASVVPNTRAAVAAILSDRGIATTLIRSDMRLPFTLDYKTPETLGSDRLAAAAAVWIGYGAETARSVVALDAGTACTYELVDRHGVYRGGTIAPGPILMQRALNRETAQLPEVPLEMPASIVGRSTIEAIQSGIMHGFIESVRGLLRRISEEMSEEVFVVATGGWSPLLGDHLEEISIVEPNLVLEGVRLLVDINR